MSGLFASGGQRIGASASASVLPNEYSGLISFRIEWLDLLADPSLRNSLASQFESVSSSVLSLLYGPALTSMFSYTGTYIYSFSDSFPI